MNLYIIIHSYGSWNSVNPFHIFMIKPNCPKFWNAHALIPHIAGHIPHIADHIPHIADHIPHIADHIPHIADHIAHIAGHIPHIADHIPHIAAHKLLKEYIMWVLFLKKLGIRENKIKKFGLVLTALIQAYMKILFAYKKRLLYI